MNSWQCLLPLGKEVKNFKRVTASSKHWPSVTWLWTEGIAQRMKQWQCHTWQDAVLNCIRDKFDEANGMTSLCSNDTTQMSTSWILSRLVKLLNQPLTTNDWVLKEHAISLQSRNSFGHFIWKISHLLLWFVSASHCFECVRHIWKKMMSHTSVHQWGFSNIQIKMWW